MAKSPKERLEEMLNAEVDRRFELEIVDRLRGKRFGPLAQKTEKKPHADETGMSDDDLAMLQALDQGDNNAAA